MTGKTLGKMATSTALEGDAVGTARSLVVTLLAHWASSSLRSEGTALVRASHLLLREGGPAPPIPAASRALRSQRRWHRGAGPWPSHQPLPQLLVSFPAPQMKPLTCERRASDVHRGPVLNGPALPSWLHLLPSPSVVTSWVVRASFLKYTADHTPPLSPSVGSSCSLQKVYKILHNLAPARLMHHTTGHLPLF